MIDEQWSGWVDMAYDPPRKISVHEFLQELQPGYGCLPGTWALDMRNEQEGDSDGQ